MTTFKDLGITDVVLDAIEKMGFLNPTEIQKQAIPVAMTGADILGSAQTGTGKTASFALPMLCDLLEHGDKDAVIILPTRELAAQVQDAVKKMTKGIKGLTSVLLIGGDSMTKQLAELKRKPRIIIGTPGRINDHLKNNKLNLGFARFLVLDETDRMLDMGFGVQIEQIVKYLPKDRQTLMFSATLPDNIMMLANKYLNNPVRIAVGDANVAAPKIEQKNINTTDTDKYSVLKSEIETAQGSVLVFAKTKYGASKLAKRLNKDSISADAIHGDLRQYQRSKVINGFRNQKYRVLVATDIVARGLDIPHIENVVNFDLPQCPEDYIHRIGRTGRNGAVGVAINLISPSDAGKWRAIARLLNPNDKSLIADDEKESKPRRNRGGWAKNKRKTSRPNSRANMKRDK